MLQTADKAVVEVFPAPSSAAEAVQEVVRRAVSPASEIGGDARLILPDERRIKTQEASIGGTVRAPFLPVPAEQGTPEGGGKAAAVVGCGLHCGVRVCWRVHLKIEPAEAGTANPDRS